MLSGSLGALGSRVGGAEGAEARRACIGGSIRKRRLRRRRSAAASSAEVKA